MKKLISFLLAAAMLLALAGCNGGDKPDGNTPGGPDQPGPSDVPDTPDTPDNPDTPDTPDEPDQPDPDAWRATVPHFTKEELPRFDGSTATAPLAVTLCAAILGVEEDEAERLITFNRTTNSYYNLIYGNADILIAGEGNQDVYDYREQEGFQWEQTAFATDAFVFVVNEANPVDSITVEQAKQIYTGQITNWSQLGGEDREIIPLQRNPEAGSQSLMEKLVMQGTPMMEPPKEYVATSMGELMEAVRGYDSDPGAIGYSVYYYAQEMRAAEGLKLLRLNGVEPLPETIRSGEYPLTNPYYVVIGADEPEGSPARVIRDWLLTEDGQRLAASQGYVSVMDLPTAQRETLPLVGSRLYDEFRDTLEPGDYGSLIPFAGVRLIDSWAADSGCIYGLMTRKGEVVVDPVFTDVWITGDIIVMNKGAGGYSRLSACAARDGSWVTGFDYTSALTTQSGVMLFDGSTLTVIRSDGTKYGPFTASDMGITADELRTMSLGPMEGGGGEWVGDKLLVKYNFDDDGSSVLYFDLNELKSDMMPIDAWYSLYDYEDEPYPEPAVPDATQIWDEALGRDAPCVLEIVQMEESNPSGVSFIHYRQDGTPLPQLDITGGDSARGIRLIDGIVQVLERNTATYYDLDTMEVIFRTYLGSEED